MFLALTLGCCLGTVAFDSARSLAEERPPAGVKILKSVPRREAEIVALFEQSRGQACEQVPVDSPIETKHFALAYDSAVRESPSDASTNRRSDLPVPTSRRTALSLGLDVSRADQSKLPLGSGGLIMDYIHGNYVVVQVRVCRDLVDDEIYLNSRPLAAMAKFRGARLTQEFVETTATSVANIRGAGLWLRAGQKPSPANLRTAVFVHKDLALVDEGGKSDIQPNYELVFVRAARARAATPAESSCMPS